MNRKFGIAHRRAAAAAPDSASAPKLLLVFHNLCVIGRSSSSTIGSRIHSSSHIGGRSGSGSGSGSDSSSDSGSGRGRGGRVRSGYDGSKLVEQDALGHAHFRAPRQHQIVCVEPNFCLFCLVFSFPVQRHGRKGAVVGEELLTGQSQVVS